MATTDSSQSITQDQYQHLLQLINQSNIQPTSASNAAIHDDAMNPNGKISFSFAHFVSNVYKSASHLTSHLSFIIDSGATDHMCSNSNLFLSMHPFSQPHTIGLSNGYNLVVSHYGDVRLHDSILLHNVLYVPLF